jgi:hypothetical protein
MTEKTYSDDEARAEIEAAERAGYEAGFAEAHAEHFAIGVAEERARVAQILTSPAAQARPQAALALALDDDSPKAATAISLLDSMAPEAAAQAVATPAPAIPSLAERAGGPEIGSAHLAPSAETSSEKIGGLMKSAVAAINASR